jgi:hypothetical protein
MTNIINNNKQDDMQLHIQKAYDIIDQYLPTIYVNEVIEKFPKGSRITKGMIRNVKNKLNARLDILNAMVEVALENKRLQEKLKKTLK